MTTESVVILDAIVAQLGIFIADLFRYLSDQLDLDTLQNRSCLLALPPSLPILSGEAI